MSSPHPAATAHLPAFVAAPDGTDILFTVTTLIVVGAVLGVGVVFFRLHTLPERIAHKSQKLQFEIVAILGLLALFTHIHAFWVAGLLLAFIDLPDFGNPLRRIAGSLEKIAGVAVQKTDETSDALAKKDSGDAASDTAAKRDGDETAPDSVPRKDDDEATPTGARTELRAEA